MSSYNVEWLNSNSQRAYPFRENASLQDGQGTITLPNYLIVDAVFCIAQGQVSEAAFYLTKMIYAGDYVTLHFGSTFNEDNPSESELKSLGSVTIVLADAVPYSSYRLSGPDDYYEDANCKIVIGDAQRLAEDIPAGVYLFTWDTAPFESHVVRPSLRAVRALQAVNGGDISGYVRGHVKLVSGNNIKLTAIGNDTIRIDAISSSGFVDACVCDGSFPVYGPVKKINGVTPDSEGEIRITAGDCIKIDTGSSELTIRDSCSVPCCGCDELAALVSNMSVADSAISRMTSNLDRLSEKQTAFYNAVIMSLM